MENRTCGECKYYVFYKGLHCHICDAKEKYVMAVGRKDMACQLFEHKEKNREVKK